MNKNYWILPIIGIILIIIIKIKYTFAPVYLSPEAKISPKKPTNEVHDLIDQINFKNRNLVSLQADVIISVKQTLNTRVFGVLKFEKDKNFRLIVWHQFTGKEMDIGTNEKYFWFWSKRMPDPFLYFAEHKNLNKTLLKTPLNPIWITESLGLHEISKENITVEKDKFWKIVQPRKSSLGEDIFVVTLTDGNQALGRYLYDSSWKLIASAEILKFEKEVPQQVLIIWHEENIRMLFEFKNIKTNTEIDPKYWELPNIPNKVELGVTFRKPLK